MKLTEKALAKAKSPTVRRELSIILRCTDQTIVRHIQKNEENGPLTTVGVLNAIKAVTHLTYAEMLEGGSVNA